MTIAALPMYDWPEVRQETDAEWQALRKTLIDNGVEVPARLTRCNREMPPVPGGIRAANGSHVAPDPADLPPDGLDFHTLWHHPGLAFAQTCWGPLEAGLIDHVSVIGQPDYSEFVGGRGIFYRSAVLMRKEGNVADADVPDTPEFSIDVDTIRGGRFVYNGPDSMSGIIALRRDLVAAGAMTGETDFNSFWSAISVSGSHRQSVIDVAEGRADVATIDCRTLDLCRRFERAIDGLRIVGWTAERKGLPYIAAPSLAQPNSLSSHG